MSRILCVMLLAFVALTASAQFDLDKPGLEGFPDRKPTAVRHALVANVDAIVPGQTFRVGIAFEVEKGSYFYYRTPGTSGGPRTLVQFHLPEGFQLGETHFPVPEVKHETIKIPVVSFVYPKSTVIFADVKAPADLKIGDKVEVRANLSYLFCDHEACRPVDDRKLRLEIPVADTAGASPFAKQFESAARNAPSLAKDNKELVVRVEAYLNTDALKPNASALLALDLSITDGFHIQPHRPANRDAIATEVILDLPDGIEFSPPLFPEPLAPLHPLEGFEEEKEFRDRATITVPLTTRRFLQPGETTISGYVRYQPCDEKGCLAPEYASFKLVIPVVSEETALNDVNSQIFAAAPVPPPPGTPTESAAPTAPSKGNDFELVREEELTGGLLKYLLYAFLGGLILNIMPCVLPVIAIKVLSFINQAGENRFQIFLLNAAYSCGVIFVFLLLACLAAFAQVGWGELFQSPEFNLAMASVVFAMGLSLLGVFEIPVPGFAGSIDTTKKEGPLGAFLTGILATLLATPCSGPFMGVTLTWSLQQSTATIFAVWGMMGLGMASPYLLCGLFPSLIKFLPKPGMWMVRFKELAGFVLMATVVYIVSFLNDAYVLPLLVILLGLAVAIWMISNLYTINSPRLRKINVRAAAAAIALVSIGAAIGYFKPLAKARQEEAFERRLAQFQNTVQPQHAVAAGESIRWIPFTEANLNQYRDQGRTIFIDFTADWCLICKWNEANAIDTSPVRQLMEEYGVVPLKADYTDRSLEIREWMERFGHRGGVPLYVIIPGNNPNQAITFSGKLSQSLVLEKTRQAGASNAGRTAAQEVSLAR